MKKINRYIDQLANKITPNTPTQTGVTARHQVNLPYSSTAHSSPSSPTRPGSPIPIHPRSKGLLINHARRWVIGKKSTNRRRCASIHNFP